MTSRSEDGGMPPGVKTRSTRPEEGSSRRQTNFRADCTVTARDKRVQVSVVRQRDNPQSFPQRLRSATPGARRTSPADSRSSRARPRLEINTDASAFALAHRHGTFMMFYAGALGTRGYNMTKQTHKNLHDRVQDIATLIANNATLAEVRAFVLELDKAIVSAQNKNEK